MTDELRKTDAGREWLKESERRAEEYLARKLEQEFGSREETTTVPQPDGGDDPAPVDSPPPSGGFTGGDRDPMPEADLDMMAPITMDR